MGIIANILGLGNSAGQIGGAVERVAEVFVPNKTKEMAQQHAEYTAALSQFEAEFQQPPTGIFNSFVNGLNRLPRPILALGTVALFIYATCDPVGFTTRMQGLGQVPEPLWWLLGGVVSFYFLAPGNCITCVRVAAPCGHRILLRCQQWTHRQRK